jgi:hypothetical protein
MMRKSLKRGRGSPVAGRTRGAKRRSANKHVTIDAAALVTRSKIRHIDRHVKAVGGPRSRKYFQLNKNRGCGGLDLKDCMDKTIGIYGDPVVIGAGSFGVLLRVDSNIGPLAIKFMFKMSQTESGEDFAEMERELAFSYYMGHKEIGPKVLDSFYYNFEYGDLPQYPMLQAVVELIIKHYAKKGEEYKRFFPLHNLWNSNMNADFIPVEIQCIVMKAYDSDCAWPLASEDLHTDIKCDIIRQMNRKIKKQIKLGLYCCDVKPGNFVVNIGPPVEVKMIDFGADFCKETQIYHGFDNDEVNPIVNLTYKDILYLSNVLQCYTMASRYMYNGADEEECKEITEAFFDHDIFRTFFASHWRYFIEWYIQNARDNYQRGDEDASNNFVWYNCQVATRNSSYSSMSRKNSEIYTMSSVAKTRDYVIKKLEQALDYMSYDMDTDSS